MDHRSQKKLVFGIAYALLFFGIAYLLYLPFKPPVTCSDGKKNQNETGVDCGGVCAVCIEEPVLQDIQVTEASWVVGGKGNTYDLVAKMENPNNDYGASLVPYEFVVKDAGGTVIFKQKGESFILPREEKYVIEPTLTLSGKPATVEFSTGRPLWEKFSGYKEKPALDVLNRRFRPSTSGVGFGVVTGLVVNNSPFDFTELGIVVILRDENGKIIATQKTTQNTLRSGEERDFTLPWPDAFPGKVTKVEVQTDANVYRTETFIRQYLPTLTERFQKLR